MRLLLHQQLVNFSTRVFYSFLQRGHNDAGYVNNIANFLSVCPQRVKLCGKRCGYTCADCARLECITTNNKAHKHTPL